MADNIPNISAGLWDDMIQILEFMVIKNNKLAEENETEESKRRASLYFSAIHHTGSVTLYREYITFGLFASVMTDESTKFIQECVDNPVLVPSKYRPRILQLLEEEAIENFEESNNYYRTLIGLPPYKTPESQFLYLDGAVYEEYGIDKIKDGSVWRYPAIHELDDLTQEIIRKTPDFQRIKKENPDAEWLGYIGDYKIPLEQARKAKEFEIIRLFPNVDPNVNQELVQKFSNEYNRARYWFVKVMWNADLEETSVNYRQFVAFAILIKALRNTLNRQFDGIIENSFLNDALVTILFDLYRIPQSLNTLPKENRRRLALELRKLIRDRAGNKVLYDIARILGFDNIIISKIVLNKIQLFDGEEQQVVHKQIPNVRDPITGVNITVDDPYHSFLRQTQAIDIKSPNPHDDIISQLHVKDYVREVTEPDPRWWEDNNPATSDGVYPSDEEGYLRNDADEIKRKEYNPQMFKEHTFGNPDDRDLPTTDPTSHLYDPVYWSVNEQTRRHPSWYLPGYNSVDTKYLMLTYHYSMAEKMFESLYLMRYLLDKKEQTETYNLQLPAYGGDKLHSIYNIVLFLTCGLNRLMFAPLGPPPTYADNDYGEIINNTMDYHRIVGYNVDLTGAEINDYLARCKYLKALDVKSYIDSATIMEKKDIPSAYAVGILGLRDYLVTQMELATSITDWREVEKFYQMIFTYDPVRDIHAKEDKIPPAPEGEYRVPDIRYKIYGMDVVLYGAKGEVGDAVRITIPTSIMNEITNHTVTVGFVSDVDEEGYITGVNFRYPKELDDYTAVPVWNNPEYNNPEDINLISDVDMDKGDLYNPSGQNGPDIQEGSYLATIGEVMATGNYVDEDYYPKGLYIRVTTLRYHTRDLYETYMDELAARDEILYKYITGAFTDQEMAIRLNEACDVLGEAIDVDLNFMRSEINGGEDMEIYLMDMIKYIKSYTVDFITSEKAYVLNDKRNPEWLRIIDGIEFDPHKPVVMTAISPMMIYDTIRQFTIGGEGNNGGMIIYDGKPYPKNEWDMEPFEHGSPRITDKLIILDEKDKIVYHYLLTKLNIKEFTLPSGLDRGTYIEDYFTVENYNGGEPYKLKVEIYLGNNPTPGEGTYSEYQYSGFDYKPGKISSVTYPILVKIGDNQLPIHFPENIHPKYGFLLPSDGNNFVGSVECEYTRRDMNNPQYARMMAAKN